MLLGQCLRPSFCWFSNKISILKWNLSSTLSISERILRKFLENVLRKVYSLFQPVIKFLLKVTLSTFIYYYNRFILTMDIISSLKSEALNIFKIIETFIELHYSMKPLKVVFCFIRIESILFCHLFKMIFTEHSDFVFVYFTVVWKKICY